MGLDHVTPAPLKPVPWPEGGDSRLEIAHEFTVGDWLVQPSLDRVCRNGADVRLRPQVMDLLVCLAHGRGRTVSREQILSTVWAGQSVADTGIARCVAELRKALGDRVHEPAVIETIPKRGYRVIAPVSYVIDAGAGRPSASGVAEATQPETRPAAARQMATVASGAEPRRTVAADRAGTADVALPGTRPRRAAGFGWVAGFVAAIMARLWFTATR